MNDVDSLINQGFVLSNVNNDSTNQPKPLENNSVLANGIKGLEEIALDVNKDGGQINV